MKRKIITLVMLTTMSLSLFGCSSVRDKPEDVTKIEETTKEDTFIDDSVYTTTLGTVTSIVDPITWSISRDGDVDAFFAALSTSYVNINGESAEATGGPGINRRFEPGVYTILWVLSDGSTVNQQVTITE